MKIKKLNIVKDTIIHGKGGGILNLIRTANNVFNEPLYVSSLPLYIQIEPAVVCNLRCKMCVAPYWKRSRDYLTFDNFEFILRQFPYLRKVSLVGVGEPLLNPELFEIIRWARKKNILIGFATNGTILTKKNIENILMSDTN